MDHLVEFHNSTKLSSLYFKRLKPPEVYIKSKGLTNNWKKYKRLREVRCVPWSNIEKDLWLKSATKTATILHKTFSMFSKTKLRLVQVPKYIEFGLPHTIDTFIFVPQGTRPSVRLLLHEQLHVYQRLFPKVFASLYRDEGYRCIPQGHFEEITSRIPKPIKKKILTNPDSLENGVWTFNNKFTILVYRFNSDQPVQLMNVSLNNNRIEKGNNLDPNEWLADIVSLMLSNLFQTQV